MKRSIPPDTLHFIQKCIDRVGTLDLLLFLQAASGRAWTVRQLSGEMRSSPVAAESGLGALLAQGLVAKEGDGYRFRPTTPELEEATRRLAECYRERRSTVIAAIYSRPGESVRSFAEAFRFKKGGSDG